MVFYVSMRHLVNILFNPLLRSSWRSVVLLWKPMAWWTIIVYALFTAILAPLLVALLNWGVFRGDRLIIGNDELLTWFFSPAGFSYLFLALLIALIGIIIRFAGLFQILTDHMHNQNVSVRTTALQIAMKIHILVRLCVVTLFGAVLLISPLIIGLWVVYLIYLSAFDINYYTITTPPEWYQAMTWASIWGGVWLIFSLIIVAGVLPALPAFLDGKKSIYESLTEVWDAPFTKTLRFLKSILVALSIWLTLRIILDASLIFIFIHLSGWIHSSFESLRLIAFITGKYLFLSITIGSIISFFGFSMISVIITKFYYGQSHPSVVQTTPGLRLLTKKTLGFITWWTKPIRLLLLMGIIFTGAFVSSYFIIQSVPENKQVLNIAHRANALGAPENSIPALENSISIGADMVEIDVQLTSDGEVILLHDADLMRVTGDSRRIREISFEDLSELLLNTNQNIPNERRKIPTLNEVLDLTNEEINLLIELKYYGYYPELAERVVHLIREKEMQDQVSIMSMSIPAVRQVYDLAPEITLGYTSAAAAGDISGLPIDFLASFHQNITPQLVSTYSQNEQPVYAWTVNQTEDIILVIEKGVDGIITDNPVLAGEIISELNGLSRAERLLLQFGFLIVEGSPD